MLSTFWLLFLYQPLFNALIWIYNNLAGQNLGWSVVWLTIFLRIILLPFTIVSEMNAGKQQKAEEEAAKAMKSYKGDYVEQKDAYRRVMKSFRISPWAKVFVLFIQALVLILLYQVFMRGINGAGVYKMLYPFIDFPGRINTIFYGFEIGKVHDLFWSGTAAVYLLVSIFMESRHRKVWQKADMIYLFIFPAFTFLVLWYLPMVKSLFILTTMIFSDIVRMIRIVAFPIKKDAPAKPSAR